MKFERSKFKLSRFGLLICAFSLGLLVFPWSASVFSGEETTATSNLVRAPIAGNPIARIEEICATINEGDFGTARGLLGRSPRSDSKAIAGLTDIVSEYEAIEHKRELGREAAYQKQLARLEKFKTAASVGNPEQAPSDPNEEEIDVNDIPKVLSVIATVVDFADERQKKQLLLDSFVKQTIQEGISRAAEDNSKGKWLDAYTDYYWWLLAIDPNNQEYSDHADQLLEKANIVSSFQDSPCESRAERYDKVEKSMFQRAVDVLNFNYVSAVDYSHMATKAIHRCALLAEVINTSQGVRDALGMGAEERYQEKLSAWLAKLKVLLDEVDQSPVGISKDKFIDVFKKVLDDNSTTLELPSGMLIAEFAEAALSALDPYTNMVWPKQAKDFERTMTNQFTGIGIEISKRKGLLTVISLLPDTPAYNSGLDAGDVIEAVDGVPTKDMTLICAVHRITGPAGTKVKLTIRRPGEDDTRDITITRAKITVPTIRGWRRSDEGKWTYFIDEERKVGYIRITSFAERTAADLDETLRKLEEEGLKGLILDLRFNTGGLLSSAIDVTDKFIAEGPIVSTRPRFAWTYASAKKKNTHPDYPLVVLINRFSASASEIVSGALQDEVHSRAVLIGERTQGKGSVQGITQYPDGGAQLKYTMAYYHLPSGKRVETREATKRQGRKDWGIGPSIEMNLTSDELDKLMNVQRHNNILVKVNHEDTEATKVKRHSPEETLAADPHLAVGVLVVKSKLILEEARSAKL
ncbi:MAG: S41 family peptidase [Planctomycetota bacterium]|jgi:carboxyl-terminal processing protease